MKAISIVGLGWLGLPLADLFIQKGYSVAGTTTSTNKQSKIANTSLTVECFNLYTDKPSDLPEDFFTESTLVLNIPPGRQNFDRIQYANRLQSLIDHAFNCQHNICIWQNR
jgi:nucleoside-diphosphate-sugar epimerase